MPYTEPKTPYTQSSPRLPSARSTPKSSSSASAATPSLAHNNNHPTPGKSSKWAKFQEKLHSYSSKSTPQSSHASPAITHLNTSFSSSVNSSFESPHDYLNFSSLEESSSSPIINLSTGKATPVSSVPTIHSNTTNPSIRTTSIPKSDSLFLSTTPPAPALPTTSSNTPFSTPPKVKPFIYSQSSLTSSTPRNKKSLVNEKCCFCEELLSSKFSTVEKLIELNCGDTCHEECLWLLINDEQGQYEAKTSDLNKIFPSCESCGKLAIPSDETITDSIISKILLSSHTPPKLTQVSNSSSSDSLIISSDFQSQLLSPRSRPTSSTSKSHKYQSLSLSSRNQKDLSIQIPSSTSRSHRSYQHPPRHKSASRGSSISAMSSIISSVSRSPSPTKVEMNPTTRTTTHDTITLSENGRLSNIPLAMLRSEYITHLIRELRTNYDPNLKESEIDSFGLLRLADNLLVSQNGEVFKNYNVYLFQYNLLLVDSGYSKIESFKLLKSPKISTPTSTILKINILTNSGENSLYLSQKSNKILQKWIAGLCDYEFIFNSDNLSSTITLPSESSDNWEPIAPHTVTTENTSDQMTIPVLLSPIKFDDVQVKSSSATPINSTKTFFEKTEDLIVIIDHEKNFSQMVVITLMNIIKVLSLKFKSLHVICSSERFSNVYYSNNGQDLSNLNNIGQISNNGIKSVNEVSQDIIANGDVSEYSALIISNNLTENALNSIIFPNQLVIQIMSYKSADLHNRENIVKLHSYDKIMEMLVSKYELSFDDSDSEYEVTDSEDPDSDSDFDSDGFEDDRDNVCEDDADSLNSDLLEQKCEEEMKEEQEEEKEDDEVELPSLSSNDESNSNNSSDHYSPISSNDCIGKGTVDSVAVKRNQNSRWSTLFRDIDDALLETATSLSKLE